MNFRNRKIVRTVQVILGLYILFAGFAGLFLNLPAPPYNEAGIALFTALFNTGYMFYVLSFIFIVCGIMFVFNKWSAFSAVLLAPITANIVLFHIFLDFTGWWLAGLFTLLHVYLIVIHWPRYKPMFGK